MVAGAQDAATVWSLVARILGKEQWRKGNRDISTKRKVTLGSREQIAWGLGKVRGLGGQSV